VVTTTVANALKLWCARSGDCISTLTLSHQDAFDFAFTAQGVNVLHTAQDCSTLWNMETGARVWEHHVGFPLWYMSRICLSRCGNWPCTFIFRHESNAGLDWYAIDMWNATRHAHAIAGWQFSVTTFTASTFHMMLGICSLSRLAM
jgi:hypothetical protein